jgi:uncharacterized repeat protein (TIGR02543 family)
MKRRFFSLILASVAVSLCMLGCDPLSGDSDATGSTTGDSTTGSSTTVSTFTVAYDGNGNTGGSVPTDSAAYESGATVTVMDNTGSLVKAGYTFGGWNANAAGSGTTYAASSTFAMGSANVTLYAQWAAKGAPTLSNLYRFSNSLNMKWTAVTGATGYNLYRFISGAWTKIYSGSALYYLDTGLSVNTAYSYYVCATYSGVEGTDSGSFSSSTLASSEMATATTKADAYEFTGNVTINCGFNDPANTANNQLWFKRTFAATTSGARKIVFTIPDIGGLIVDAYYYDGTTLLTSTPLSGNGDSVWVTDKQDASTYYLRLVWSGNATASGKFTLQSSYSR